MSTIYVDNLQPNLGSGVIIAGHTLQTVHGVTSTQVDISASTNVWTSVYTNLATITPKSSSSKILITGVITFYSPSTDGNFYCDLAINRNGSLQGEIMGYAGFHRTTSSTLMDTMNNIPFTYLDSPASTSALNYGFSVRVKNYGQGNSTVSFTYDDSGGDQQSSFVLQEIAQ